MNDPLITPEVSNAMHLLEGMTDEQRGRIFCWFCPGCYKHVGPGQSCTCVVVLTQAEIRETLADAWDDGHAWGYDGDTTATNPHRDPCLSKTT